MTKCSICDEEKDDAEAIIPESRPICSVCLKKTLLYCLDFAIAYEEYSKNILAGKKQ